MFRVLKQFWSPGGGNPVQVRFGPQMGDYYLLLYGDGHLALVNAHPTETGKTTTTTHKLPLGVQLDNIRLRDETGGLTTPVCISNTGSPYGSGAYGIRFLTGHSDNALRQYNTWLEQNPTAGDRDVITVPTSAVPSSLLYEWGSEKVAIGLNTDQMEQRDISTGTVNWSVNFSRSIPPGGPPPYPLLSGMKPKAIYGGTDEYWMIHGTDPTILACYSRSTDVMLWEVKLPWSLVGLTDSRGGGLSNGLGGAGKVMLFYQSGSKTCGTPVNIVGPFAATVNTLYKTGSGPTLRDAVATAYAATVSWPWWTTYFTSYYQYEGPYAPDSYGNRYTVYIARAYMKIQTGVCLEGLTLASSKLLFSGPTDSYPTTLCRAYTGIHKGTGSTGIVTDADWDAFESTALDTVPMFEPYVPPSTPYYVWMDLSTSLVNMSSTDKSGWTSLAFIADDQNSSPVHLSPTGQGDPLYGFYAAGLRQLTVECSIS